jgi:hypothetical protein
MLPVAQASGRGGTVTAGDSTATGDELATVDALADGDGAVVPGVTEPPDVAEALGADTLGDAACDAGALAGLLGRAVPVGVDGALVAPLLPQATTSSTSGRIASDLGLVTGPPPRRAEDSQTRRRPRFSADGRA